MKPSASYFRTLLGLMPAGVRGAVSLLPFGAMQGFPAEVAAGWLNGAAVVRGFLVQLTWVGLLVGLTCLVWHRGVRRYTTLGS